MSNPIIPHAAGSCQSDNQINTPLAADLLAFYRFMESVDATGDCLDTLFHDMYAGTEDERFDATTAWAEYSVLLDSIREQVDGLDAVFHPPERPVLPDLFTVDGFSVHQDPEDRRYVVESPASDPIASYASLYQAIERAKYEYREARSGAEGGEP